MNLVEVLALLTFILSLLSLIVEVIRLTVEVMDKIYRKKDNENKKD
jgi:hypothetical protein